MANQVTKKLPNTLPDTIGGRLQLLRIRSGEKQDDIAQKNGIASRVMLAYYENNERTIPLEVASRLAKYFGVSVDFLLCHTDIETPKADDKAIINSLGLTQESIDILRFYKDLIDNKKTNDPYFHIAPYVLHNVNAVIKTNGKEYTLDPMKSVAPYKDYLKK